LASTLSKNWIKGFDTLDEWIGSHVDDSYQIPLAFMLRHDPKPTLFVEPDVPSLASEYADFCPRLVSDGMLDKPAVWYESANTKLWGIMFSIFNDHPSYAHIQSSRHTKDGHGAYNALRQHYLGEDAVENMAGEMEAAWNCLTYTGEGRWWNFEKYVTKHVELYAHSCDLKRYGYAGIDASSCVRRFMFGIKTNKLDHARGTVNGNRHLKKDFEQVVQVYKDFITQDNLQNIGKQQPSQIAIVKSDGDGGGKRRQAKRANGQISQVSVSDRYYTAAEYAKLSKDEKEALYQLRRGRKRQRGNDGNARTTVLKADAGSASSNVDDDRTVALSNGRTSNRTNSALVRQRRPKQG
jgi:hypothetical protein